MVSALTAAAKSGVMNVESPTQLPDEFSADAPPPPGSPSGSPPPPPGSGVASPEADGGSFGPSAVSERPDSERPAWVKIIDRKTREPYYWNRITQEVQWKAPLVEEEVSERDRRIADKTRYYADFIGPADAAARAEVEVDEELDREEQEKLKGTKDEMKRVFERIDENGNGYLDAEELRKLAGIIDPDGLSTVELEAALSMMDEDGDDEIDFEEFFEWWSEVNARTDGKMFAIFDGFRAALKAEAEAEEAAKKPRKVVERFDDKKGKLLARTLRNELGDMFKQSGLDMKEAFRAFDADGDGTITQEEFKAGLRSLQLKITEDQIDDLVGSIDQDGDGNLDYLEFVEQFQPKGVKGKSSALAQVIYAEEERLGYHDGAETSEELAELAAAERKRIEDADEDYDTPDGGGGPITVVNEDGTVEVVEGGGGGGDGSEACAVPPLTPFRVCTASMPLPSMCPPATAPSGGGAVSCPRLFCILPSPHAKARPDTMAERTVLGGGFLEEEGWRNDTFQIHVLCEWGCGHWLDPKAGLPLIQPKKAVKHLAPALRPNHGKKNASF
jgi:Ca2+-binding EF-hand superfamily protein